MERIFELSGQVTLQSLLSSQTYGPIKITVSLAGDFKACCGGPDGLGSLLVPHGKYEIVYLSFF